ncbi:45993_t:CDS:2 [Gigaspora margarita]|uniref:45993_t:CDS:1 n=1 Tax=Gigaspora margarita TaxID=4874 RepID=A0ABM8VZN0_GIGMA|nr:45993_t:CDS:2 [Gigaspora margarita]
MSKYSNETVENLINNERVKQEHYDSFDEFKEICRGPFGIVRKATWGDKTVVLKSLNNATNETHVKALESIQSFKSIKLTKFKKLTTSMDNLFPTHEETPQSNEEAFQSSEDASQSNEDSSQSNEETSHSIKKTFQSNEENASNTNGIRSLKIKLENRRFIHSIRKIFPSSADDAGSGPSFGYLDLFVSGSNLKTWRCCQSNYKKAIKILESETQSQNFQIEDYEVFKI